MNYLLCGGEPEERMNIIIGLADVRSPAKIAAAKYHFVEGLPAPRAYARAGLKQSKFHDLKNKLNYFAGEIEKIKDIDYGRV